MIKDVVVCMLILLIVGCGQEINSEGPDPLEQAAKATYLAEQEDEMAAELTADASFEKSERAQAAYYAELEKQQEKLTSYISVPVANVRKCPDLSCPVALQLKLNTPLFDPLPVESAPEWLEIEIDGKWYYVHQSVVSENPVPVPTLTDVPPITFPTPADIPSVADGCPYGCINPPAGCNIKGNISFDTGERIYHLPGDDFYDQTVINTNYGERWFCTSEAAEANGWRRSYQ